MQVHNVFFFSVHFFAVVALLRRETSQFHVLWWTWVENNDVRFPFSELSYSPLGSTPEEFLNIKQVV